MKRILDKTAVAHFSKLGDIVAMLIVKETFTIPDQGIIVLLQHEEAGLARGKVLTSKQTQKSWKVAARIKYNHALDIHREFATEDVSFVHLRFEQEADRTASAEMIEEEEEHGIYHYMIKPFEHDSAPENGEELLLV